jgi:transposase-like protein
MLEGNWFRRFRETLGESAEPPRANAGSHRSVVRTPRRIAARDEVLRLDKRLAEAKLELACSGKANPSCYLRIGKLWLRRRFMLEKVCEVYENERQPETLREASSFLKSLSDGKYVRVWTPLGKNALRIGQCSGPIVALGSTESWNT